MTDAMISRLRARAIAHVEAELPSVLLLPEAAVLQQVREYVLMDFKQSWPSSERRLCEFMEGWLSRLVSPDWALHYATSDLKLFGTKGCEYSTLIGQKISVTYSEEDQDTEGYYETVEQTYVGRVTAFDPFKGLTVKFEEGDEEGDTLMVNDEDEWEWAHSRCVPAQAAAAS